jgi:dTDP-4-amino-4,6-dideoxygalactose transaminase
MKNYEISLSSPHMGDQELKFIMEAFQSNWVSSTGPHLIGFESALEKHLGKDKTVTTLSSGTAAIHLGLILLGVQADDEVICQSMTFSASVNPILYLGATPVFIDSEVDTWNLCPITLEKAIIARIKSGKTPKAIIAVHLYGVPYQIEKVRAVADKYNISILEDSAEALGSSYKGQ